MFGEGGGYGHVMVCILGCLASSSRMVLWLNAYQDALLRSGRFREEWDGFIQSMVWRRYILCWGSAIMN